MAEVKTYTLTLDAQELHDLIEAVLVCECQAAQIINGLKRKGLDLDAQKLVTQTPVWRVSSGGCRRRRRISGMRKLILSGDDWFELKHTLELLVIATHNEANEFEAMAAHQPAEIAERAANLAKRRRERMENYKRLMALVESAERLPDTKEDAE